LKSITEFILITKDLRFYKYHYLLENQPKWEKIPAVRISRRSKHFHRYVFYVSAY
jgi:hypothetical protein